MTGPYAAVRIQLSELMAEDDGYWPTHAADRYVRHLLYDLPPKARVTIDLGDLRSISAGILRELVRCAERVTFEAENWDVALKAADELTALVQTAEVA
jgi:hypothetical protein